MKSNNISNTIEPPQFLAKIIKQQRNFRGYKINVKDYRRNIQLRLRNYASHSHSSASIVHSHLNSQEASKIVTPKGNKNINVNKFEGIKTNKKRLNNSMNKTIETTEFKQMNLLQRIREVEPKQNIIDERMHEYINYVKRKKQQQDDEAAYLLFMQENQRIRTTAQFTRVRNTTSQYSYIRERKKKSQPHQFAKNQQMLRSKQFNATNYFQKLKIKQKRAKYSRQKSMNRVDEKNSEYQFLKTKLQKTQTQLFKKKRKLNKESIESHKANKILENSILKQSKLDIQQTGNKTLNYAQIHLSLMKQFHPKKSCINPHLIIKKTQIKN